MVTFEELGVDIIPNIFSYLSLAERVKYERISKAVRSTLLTLWRHQTRLVIACKNIPAYRCLKKCFIKSHTFYECDIINIRPICIRQRERVIRNLLERSPKLKSLAIGVDQIGYIYEKLKLPSTIEHLASHWFDKLEMTSSDSLVCVIDLMCEDDRQNNITCGPDVLEPKPLNISYLYRHGVEHMWTMKITDFEEASREVEIRKFSSLRELTISSNDASRILSLNPRHCPNLERLSIYLFPFMFPYMNEAQNQVEMVKTFVSRYGKQLKHFELINLSESVLDKIDFGLMASTLEELSLRVGQFDFEQFEQQKFIFARLRKLRIQNQLYSWAGFLHLLEKCPKLRHLELGAKLSPLFFQKVAISLDKFANEHPKRRITLTVAFDDDVDFNVITSGLIIKKTR